MAADKRKATFQPYDMDTAAGTNNSGVLMFGYALEDTDTVSSIISGGDDGGKDAPVFNAQDSVLWNNFRDCFRSEITQMYRSLRTSRALDYKDIMQRRHDHQSYWPEAMFNEDQYEKHLVPLINPVTVDDTTGELIRTDRYLTMIQGSKEEQFKWWLYNRFRYMDSKFVTGDAANNIISMRVFNSGTLTLTPAIDLYVGVSFGGGTTVALKRTTANVPKSFQYQAETGVTEMETWIYSGDLIADLGDLSVFYGNEFDLSKATRLRHLKIGDPSASYSNANLVTLDLRNMGLLEYVDLRNCPNLAIPINLEGSPRLEEAYFEGTAITGVDIAEGGSIEKLHLPGTIATLTLINLSKLTDFQCPSLANVSRVMLSNMDQDVIDPIDVLAQIKPNSQVNIQGLYMECENAQEIEGFLNILDTMQGVSRERGANGEWLYHDYDTAQVSGTIHTASLTGEQIASYNARYPYIKVEADHVTSYLTYASYDGTTTYKVVTCLDGVPQESAPTGLTRANSADGHYSYTFAGWSKSMDAEAADPDALDNVIADRTVYAAYSKTVRTYTVTWRNSNGTTLETDENVAWGTMPSYNGSTPQNPSGSSPFTAWTPTPARITGNTTYTATYTPVYNVYFYNGSTLLDTVQVLQGGNATYTGPEPTDGDKIFTGWSPSPTNVQGNLSTYAQFKANVETPTATTADGAYGVEWDYSQTSPQLTRKGLAASFADPVPAEGVSGSGSSPFDSIMPWAGMKRYNVIGSEYVPETDSRFDQAANDTVVYIPEFYYTSYKDTANSKWLWAISPTAKEGYCKHPGSGRYVGRYHTGGSSSGVYTKSGVAPLANTSQTSFRSYSASKGNGWGMMDLATWSAIQMLYLVEFAHFNSQDKLGKGWNTGSVGTMGGTDSAAYHTVKATGAHNQYRWIEDLYSNVRDWIDGFVGSTSKTYAAANSTYKGGPSDLNELGFALPTSGKFITGIGYSESAAWAIIPDASSSSATETTYVCDRVSSSSSLYPAYVGGGYSDSASYGLFYFSASSGASFTGAHLGSRLQKT